MTISEDIENNIDPLNEKIIIVEPFSPWHLINFRELIEYRDLFFFLVWRDIKVLYAQTILGFSWAILQPLTQIIIFTIIFGKVAKIDTDGIPYFLFSTAGIIPWTFMSDALTHSSQSLVTGQQMLGKIYFPRLIFPLTSVFSKLVSFSISISILILTMLYYRVMPNLTILFTPLFIMLMMFISAGLGMWLSAMAIRFRDVKYAMGFVVRMLMYSAPIVYPMSKIPEKWRFIYSINPIVGTIEGFRACLLGLPIPWPYIYPGITSAIILMISGTFYFKYMEKVFVDVI
jgi:lipopolysaccharide transport system permease protein